MIWTFLLMKTILDSIASLTLWGIHKSFKTSLWFSYYFIWVFLRLNLPGSILENHDDLDYDFEQSILRF